MNAWPARSELGDQIDGLRKLLLELLDAPRGRASARSMQRHRADRDGSDAADPDQSTYGDGSGDTSTTGREDRRQDDERRS